MQTSEATPAATLRSRLLDSSAKDEEKHFAARYIRDLERVLRELTEATGAMKKQSDYLPGDKAQRRFDALASAEKILSRIP